MPLAYSPIGQGRLTGKYSAAEPSAGAGAPSPHTRWSRWIRIVAELRRIGEANGGRTPSQVALRWIMDKGAVPIPGAKNAEQATQNAGALGWSLDPDDAAALDRVALEGTRTIAQRVWQHG